ncbi:MAG TPA: acetylglutamate kinase [Leptospiraceae bacterium]|nr:acetylglutamate kinase [Leptospiraceae bacterium]HMW03940.1 acetylglutamate kinase [Leptospiraceae bacterium]HMX33159.1 acetylglutamate kinase [Leptospiraceae bacterium]HMY29920.1 acetylglutamate kinase [Leptospiraceae bacterium]HMZ67126.1 acetylglutamate kinase [Leptospiraceae bacterium]
MEESISKIKNILEALPYITEFSNKVIVIKYGGAAMVKEDLKESFARDIVLLKYLGIHPIIVHGGGPEINQILDVLKLPVKFVRGHRVTDEKTMEVVEMVLSGKLNKQIVSLINSKSGQAIGLSGRDGKLALAEIQKIEVLTGEGKTELVDVGFVGRITKINKQLIQSLLDAKTIPVISPVAEDLNGQALNINADTMAGAIAGALNAEKLILLTDTPGILIKGKLAEFLNEAEVRELIQSGEISGGMIPKVECCLDAIQNGVKKTHIIDGRIQHSILMELFTESGIGTLIS